MKRFTGWTTAFAATALLAGPVAVAAQQTSTPAAEPTAASAPAPQSPATPAQADPAAAAQPTPTQQPQVDPDTVKRHLTAARDSLSQITQLPAASQLTGDARTQVSQLISNFNELITTTTEWRALYAKVQANLTALIGDQRTDESPATAATGTPGAVGTSGTVAIDPAIKTKLVEFRSHLMEFEKAAGGAPATSLSSSSQSQPGASSPAAATTASTSPSEPAAAATTAAAATAATATTGSTAAQPSTAGTSGATSSIPAAAASSTAPAEPGHSRPATPSAQNPTPTAAQQSGHAEAMRHIEAIEAILNGRATGSATAGTSGTTASVTTLDHDKIEQVKTHLAELRRALAQGGGR